MRLPRVIGLAGKKRSGKSTLARELSTLGYQDVAFADPLRDMLYRMNPILDSEGCRLQDAIDEYGWEWSKDNLPETRRLLQFLGTEVVRHVDEDYWVRIMREKICDTDGYFVVADVRMQNEADLIRECGGVVIEIQRPSLGPLVDPHSSEQGIVADWVLINSGSPEELYHDFLGEISDLEG